MATIETLPPMPRIGRLEEYYASKIRYADQARDIHLKESLKVGQYVSLALGSGLPWLKKARYFEHAIHRHCQPPIDANEAVIAFYDQLKHLIRRYAGEEAISLVSRQDDVFADRIRRGESTAEVKIDAITFFSEILGDSHRMPDYFNYEDWHQIVVMRNAWCEMARA